MELFSAENRLSWVHFASQNNVFQWFKSFKFSQSAKIYEVHSKMNDVYIPFDWILEREKNATHFMPNYPHLIFTGRVLINNPKRFHNYFWATLYYWNKNILSTNTLQETESVRYLFIAANNLVMGIALAVSTLSCGIILISYMQITVMWVSFFFLPGDICLSFKLVRVEMCEN